MSKTSICVLSLMTLPFLLMSSAMADTVTLKTGEHLEGKVTAETDKDVTIQVQVSAGITDERVIPRAKIEKVEKISPEIEAYRQIAGIQFGKDSMTVAQYEPYIRALQNFVEMYPKSTRAPEVQKTLDAFEEEQKRVEKGEIKMDGQWLSKAQVAKEKVQIGGQLAFSYMKGQSAQGDYIGALNTFAAIEKSFPGAEVMPEAIELAQKDLIQLEGEVRRAIPDQKAIEARHKKDVAAAGPTDRAVMTAAIKREQDAEDAALQKATGSAWPPFYKDSEKSLTALMARMNTEGPRLAGLPVDKMKDSLILTADAKRSMTSGDVNGGLEKLKQATALWPANEYAQRLAKEATEEQKGLAATPGPAAAATPAAATPRMQRSGPMPKAQTTSAETTAPVAASTPAPAAAATTTTTTTTATKTTTAPASDSSDDESFVTMPRIIMAVALVALLLIGGKIMKKRKQEDA